MSDLKNDVVSLEVAKKLPLPDGWESQNYWHEFDRGEGIKEWDVVAKSFIIWTKHNVHTREKENVFIPAPTLSEMLRLLPVQIDFHADEKPHGEDAEIVIDRIKTNERLPDGSLSPYYTLYIIAYRSLNYVEEEFNSKINFTEAAANLYIWLHENGHITVAQTG